VVLRASRTAERVVIEVLDNGPGIAESVRERLFQPYATSKVGGTGLGLALVQRIVGEHGGVVSAVPGLARQGGAGAGFRVELPVA
jgi:signal transduction histidine kinase